MDANIIAPSVVGGIIIVITTTGLLKGKIHPLGCYSRKDNKDNTKPEEKVTSPIVRREQTQKQRQSSDSPPTDVSKV